MDDDGPRFDAASVTPLYEQAADYVEAEIKARRLKPGAKLDAMTDLADDWGVSLDTVKRAMALLRERGLVVQRVGKGTFVAGGG